MSLTLVHILFISGILVALAGFTVSNINRCVVLIAIASALVISAVIIQVIREESAQRPPSAAPGHASFVFPRSGEMAWGRSPWVTVLFGRSGGHFLPGSGTLQNAPGRFEPSRDPSGSELRAPRGVKEGFRAPEFLLKPTFWTPAPSATEVVA